jgi:micrococcal nuclease
MYEYKAEVYNVVDGDTVDVIVDLGFKIYTKQRIRLAGIDTPERGQPGYAEATARLKELVLGKTFHLVTTKQSKWGYFLGELLDLSDMLEWNVSINKILLSEGLAKPYSGGTKE